MAREVSILIRAKNLMQRELARAGAALQKFGQSAKRIGAFFGKAFLGAGAALVGFAAKAIHAYAGLEKSTAGLAASLESYGENSKAVLPVLRAQAKAIQDATGQTHAQTFAVMNQLKLQGVHTDKLADATKGVMALKRAGMAEEAASRAMTAATMGNFQALTRYIPELRVATDEADKLRIVNEFLSRGYSAQQDELNTVAGQWENLKGRVGDVWEAIGAAIAQNDILTNALARASDAVKRFSERVADWAGSGGAANLIATAQHFFEIMRNGFMVASNASHRFFAGLGDAGESVFKYVIGIGDQWNKSMLTHFRGMVSVVKAAFNAIRSPSREAFREIGRAAKQAAQDSIDASIDMARAFANGDAIVTTRTDKALAARRALEQQHAANVEKINADHIARLNGQTQERVQSEKDAIGDVIDAKALAVAEEQALKKRQADLEKQIASARHREAQERINDLRAQQSEQQRLASMTVKQYIDEQREAEKAAKAEERREKNDAAREKRIRATLARGGRIHDNERRFLQAREAITGARELPAEIKRAEQQLAEMRDQNRTLADLLAEQKSVHTDLKRLLAMG